MWENWDRYGFLYKFKKISEALYQKRLSNRIIEILLMETHELRIFYINMRSSWKMR